PGASDHAGVGAFLETLEGTLDPGAGPGHGRTFRVPVLFGGAAGPDIGAVAEELHLSSQALVERLTAAPWRVRFVASPVGTPFTDRGDWDLTVARMGQPRVAVAPGSMALSGSQSIIYPVRSPGGWRLVGRTPVRLVDPRAQELVAYRAGDALHYVAIDEERYAELAEGDAGLDVGS
ncbi:MAG: carboxyltransferase protein, partial [Marmoricola sp.]|nr:carboxyltransferase protein [Marmoricola sp.]